MVCGDTTSKGIPKKSDHISGRVLLLKNEDAPLSFDAWYIKPTLFRQVCFCIRAVDNIRGVNRRRCHSRHAGWNSAAILTIMEYNMNAWRQHPSWYLHMDVSGLLLLI